MIMGPGFSQSSTLITYELTGLREVMGQLKVNAMMYHDIVSARDNDASGFSGKDSAWYKLSPEMFHAHLRAIAKKVRTPPIVFNELPSQSLSFAWLITFDDGGVGAYMHAADLLERQGWRGHFFVTTNYIGRHAFLTKQEIRELRARGHIIGSHSCSHPSRIVSYCPNEILTEWRDSVALLSDIMGEQVNVASIPGGFYSKEIVRSSFLAGIKVLFTSEPTSRTQIVDGCLVIGRYLINRNTGPSTAAALAAGQPMFCWLQWLWWNSKKVLKIVSGERYEKIRKMLLIKMRSFHSYS